MRFIGLILLIILPFFLPAQVPVPVMEDREYPGASATETRLEAALASFFEESEVGNLHVYARPAEGTAQEYYFQGEALPPAYLDYLEPAWQDALAPGLKPYAVFTIRGYNEPYYLIRFEGKGSKNALELFEMTDTLLVHRATLARRWQAGDQYIQEDAWIQDVDGDTLLDIIKKVRIYDTPAGDKVLSEYQTLYVQDKDGAFYPTSSRPMEWNDYRMEPFHR